MAWQIFVIFILLSEFMNKLIKQNKLIVDFPCETIEWVVGEKTCMVCNKYGAPFKEKNIFSEKHGDEKLIDILHKALSEELAKL
jgi:hypothetical protein